MSSPARPTTATDLSARPSAGRSRWLPGMPPAAGLVLAVLAAGLVIAIGASGATVERYVGESVAIFGVAALAQDLLIGRAGQFSIGGAAFLSVGAYTCGLLTLHGSPNVLVVLVASAVAGAVVGVVVGLTAVRLRGLYLLVASLALHFIVGYFAVRLQRAYAPSGFIIPPSSVGSVTFVASRAGYFSCWVVVVLVIGLVAAVSRAYPGRAWSLVRESEISARLVGVRTGTWKLVAFGLSSALTSMAGCMFAYFAGVVTASSFGFDVAVTLIVMVFVGGQRTSVGPLLGATFVLALPYLVRDGANGAHLGVSPTNFASVSSIVYGVALLVVLIAAPGGIAAAPRALAGVTERAGRLVRRGRGDGEPRPSDGGRLPLGAPSDPAADQAAGQAARGVLEVADLTVRYSGGASAVERVSLTARPGEIVAIVGRNGSGKTSVLRAIAGFFDSERVAISGRVRLDDHVLGGLGAEARSGLGILLVPERDSLCHGLTVRENLVAAGLSPSVLAETVRVFPSLEGKLGAAAGLLSGGQRQALTLTIARARRPAVLLVDEASSGLSRAAAEQMAALLRSIADDGVTVVVVEQDERMAAGLADLLLRMDHGVVVASARADPAVT